MYPHCMNMNTVMLKKLFLDLEGAHHVSVLDYVY
jgi:hypothetical protein